MLSIPYPGDLRDIYNRVSSFLDSLKESGAKNVLCCSAACWHTQVYAGHTKLKTSLMDLYLRRNDRDPMFKRDKLI